MRVSGEEIVRTNVTASTIVFVINSMVNVNVQKAIPVIVASLSVPAIAMV